jgi:uncharacterized protein YecT (DUF1311 family)
VAAVFWLAVAAHLAPAWAQSSPATACDDKPSAPEQRTCLEALLRQADTALNSAYQRALRYIDADTDSTPLQRQAWKHALQVAQRNWIAFRDSDCGDLISYEWHSGSGTGTASLSCLLDKTTRRSQQLTQRYTDN